MLLSKDMDLLLSSQPPTTTNPSITLWLFGAGIIFTIISLTYKISLIETWDRRAFLLINNNLNTFIRFYRYVWPLGTTPVALIIVSMLFLSSIRAGFIVSITFSFLLIVERIIKISLNRTRPFVTSNWTKVSQPVIPKDPSYPSGDAMRMIFLAITVPLIFDLSSIAVVSTCLLGIILSLGRIILGVHYPLDVLGGMGLGLLGAAIVSFSLVSPLVLNLYPAT